MTTAADAAVGRVVDGTYVLEACLGSGGMGSVYSARHVRLDKAFALKLIRQKHLDSEGGRRRFEVEARALGRLDHPNIVRVTDYGIDEDDGTPYLVMELLRGRGLKEVLDEQGPLAPERAIALVEDVAAGLDHAHRAGILHRDLKPRNIILCPDDSAGERALIVDFGLARFVAPSASDSRSQRSGLEADRALDGPDGDETATLPANGWSGPQPPARRGGDPCAAAGAVDPSGWTRAGTLIGTAGYMAPELVNRGSATAAADIYSLGVVAYEMLVGRRPFTGGVMAVLRAHAFERPQAPSEANPSLPRELDRSLLDPLLKEPENRPGTASAVAAGLAAAWDRVLERRFRSRELGRRAALSVLLVAAAALVGWRAPSWPLVDDLESRLLDLRFATASARPADPRLVLAVIDDATLDADPRRRALAEYDGELAGVIARVLQGGALGVGIDIVVPDSWSDSVPFVDLLLGEPERLVLAAHWDGGAGRLLGTGVARGAVSTVLLPDRAAGLFGLANLSQDRDGVVRVQRLGFRGTDGRWIPVFAARCAAVMAGEAPAVPDPMWIDYRVDWQSVPRWSWAELAAAVNRDPELLAGRFLLVGGDIEAYGDTSYPVPGRRKAGVRVPGVVLQALMVSNLLDHRPLLASGREPLVAAVVVLGPIVFALLWWRRAWAGVAVGVTGIAAGVASAWAAFDVSDRVVPIAGPVLACGLAMLGGLAIRWALPARPERQVRTTGIGRTSMRRAEP
jgi:serine/threonine protein kinase